MSPEPDFEQIALHCRGMLAPSIYRRIYSAARDRPGGDIVEVGTARGAATVAMALGLRDSGLPGKVVTFGRVQGDRERTRESLTRTFDRFEVTAHIRLVIGDVGETAKELGYEGDIGLLMLDADGRIDRDFLLFFHRLLPKAPIIVDDCRDQVLVKPRDRGDGYSIDCKRLLTHRLLDYFKSKQLISDGILMRDTYFGEKASAPASAIDLEEVLEIYRGLVFSDAEKAPHMRKTLVRLFERMFPVWVNRVRSKYRDRKATNGYGFSLG